MHELMASKPWVIYPFVFGAFFLGAVISAIVGAGAVNDRIANPEPTTITETETVTKKVTETPKVCKTALEHADELAEQNKKMQRIAGYAVSYATGYNNGSELAESERLAEKLVEDIKATEAEYDKAAKECRGQ